MCFRLKPWHPACLGSPGWSSLQTFCASCSGFSLKSSSTLSCPSTCLGLLRRCQGRWLQLGSASWRRLAAIYIRRGTGFAWRVFFASITDLPCHQLDSQQGLKSSSTVTIKGPRMLEHYSWHYNREDLLTIAENNHRGRVQWRKHGKGLAFGTLQCVQDFPMKFPSPLFLFTKKISKIIK